MIKEVVCENVTVDQREKLVALIGERTELILSLTTKRKGDVFITDDVVRYPHIKLTEEGGIQGFAHALLFDPKLIKNCGEDFLSVPRVDFDQLYFMFKTFHNLAPEPLTASNEY